MKKILKKGLAVFTCAALTAAFALSGCGQQEILSNKDCTAAEKESTDSKESRQTKDANKLQKVTLNEVAHSIFYAPMYVAIENGYFQSEGIELELVTGFGADKVMAAVLSGDADIGFMGPETTVYTATEGTTDPVINFAQLTQRAGNFLVAREPAKDFEWKDLKDQEVLGGRAGGIHISM